MPEYTYVENVEPADHTGEIILRSGALIVFRGQWADFTIPEIDVLSRRFVLMAGRHGPPAMEGEKSGLRLEDLGDVNITSPVSGSVPVYDSGTQTWVDALLEGQNVAATVDTGELFKIIMLSDGTVKAVPEAVEPPAAPTDLVATPTLTAAKLAWTAAAGAAKYLVYRDGVKIAESDSLSYYDSTIQVGSTYSYRVATRDVYGQVSPRSNTATAFIDPDSNSEPQDVSVRSWPSPLPTSGQAIIRVNAREQDLQTIAYALSVDAGQLISTADPSVWLLTI